MPKGVSRSHEEIKSIIDLVERWSKKQNEDISTACNHYGISRKSYYHYLKKLKNYTPDKRQHKNQQFHSTGQQFLYEIALLCPILSTRTLHELYNNIFVVYYNQKIYSFKNPKASPFPWKKELNEYLKSKNYTRAEPESYWRVYNCLKKMGLEKMEQHIVTDKRGNSTKQDGRLEKGLNFIIPIVKEELDDAFMITEDSGLIKTIKNINIENTSIGNYEMLLDVVARRIQLKSIDLPIGFLAWLKSYASRNPKKATNFMNKLLAIKK